MGSPSLDSFQLPQACCRDPFWILPCSPFTLIKLSLPYLVARFICKCMIRSCTVLLIQFNYKSRNSNTPLMHCNIHLLIPGWYLVQHKKQIHGFLKIQHVSLSQLSRVHFFNSLAGSKFFMADLGKFALCISAAISWNLLQQELKLKAFGHLMALLICMVSYDRYFCWFDLPICIFFCVFMV